MILLKIRADKSTVERAKIVPGDIKYGVTQFIASSPVLFPTVTFRLKLTPELEKLAEKVDTSADGTQEYTFYARITSYTKLKTDKHLMLVVYYEDGDESTHMIELKEEARKALYERLDEQSRKKAGKSCCELLEEAEAKMTQ